VTSRHARSVPDISIQTFQGRAWGRICRLRERHGPLLSFSDQSVSTGQSEGQFSVRPDSGLPKSEGRTHLIWGGGVQIVSYKSHVLSPVGCTRQTGPDLCACSLC